MVRMLWMGGVPWSDRSLRKQWLKKYVLYSLKGVESTIYRTSSGSYAFSDPNLTSSDFKVETVRYRKVALLYRFSPVIMWHVMTRSYDFVFTCMLGSFPTICVFILAHLIRRRRYVVMAENWYPRSNRFVNLWHRQVAIRATLVIAQSTKAYNFMKESLKVPEARLIKCVNTLEDPTKLAYNKQLLQELDSDESIKLVCVARFIETKGQDVLIEAVNELNISGVKLFLVGNCETKFGEACKRLAGDDPRIIFVGKAKFEDVLAYYRACDAFLLPNKFTNDRFEGAESFGYAALEAAYFGLPLILTTATGCADDIIVEGKTGYQVPENDIGALRDKLRFLVADPAAMKAMSTDVRTHVCELCSETSIANFKLALERVLEEFSSGCSRTGARL